VRLKVYVVDFETPKWLRRALAFGVPIVVIAFAVTVVIAAPQQWQTNDVLQASALNSLSVVTSNGSRYSVGATKYCGASPSATLGTISYGAATGYAAAKKICETAPSCGNSATAHMCTSEELVRSTALGMRIQVGWFATGALAEYFPGSGTTTFVSNDCNGYMTLVDTNNNPFYGALWSGTSATWYICSLSQPVLCCD
jgi:hypothetical protein